jgi:hypothetical protein
MIYCLCVSKRPFRCFIYHGPQHSQSNSSTVVDALIFSHILDFAVKRVGDLYYFYVEVKMWVDNNRPHMLFTSNSYPHMWIRIMLEQFSVR